MTALGTGLGWRPELALHTLEYAKLGFVEVLAENYDLSRPIPSPLRALKERGVQIVVHGVGASLGGAEPLYLPAIERLARVAERLDAVCVSEHVAIVRSGQLESGHLLPVERTPEALELLIERVRRARALIGRPFALENIATLVRVPGSTMSEGAFFSTLLTETRTDLLLDVANLYANARNFGEDIGAMLDALPLERIAYVHVAGGTLRQQRYIDTHAHPVPAGALDVLLQLIKRAPVPGVMLERDSHFPQMAELHAELDAIHELRLQAPAPATQRQSEPPFEPFGDLKAPALEERQHALFEAVLNGGPTPPGYDAGELEACARSLVMKRRGVARDAWRALFESLADVKPDPFLKFAREVPLNRDASGRVDVLSYAHWLGAQRPPSMDRELALRDLKGTWSMSRVNGAIAMSFGSLGRFAFARRRSGLTRHDRRPQSG